MESQDEKLRNTAKACAEEMNKFADQLEALNKASSGLGRQWNKLRVFLKEEDLQRMSDVVIGYTAELDLYLEILESDTLISVRDDVKAILPL